MIKNFLNRLHIPGTITQIGELNNVALIGGEGDIDDYLLKNEDKNIFFLAGVKKEVGKSRASNMDVEKRKYLVVDFDLRNQIQDEGFEVRDDEIKQFGSFVAKELDKHDGLNGWSYIVFSGNGLHVYYVGDAVLADGYYEAGVDEIYKRIESVITDYKVDFACKNPARIIRLPGSYNNKKGKKKVEFLESRKVESGLFNSIRDLGKSVIDKAKQDAMKKEIKLVLQTDSTVYEAINKIPVGEIVSKHFGWQFDGKSFTEAGKKKPKACFVPPGENFIVHGGTDHFSTAKKGLCPFQFVGDVMGLSASDTFKWFKDNFKEIEDLDEVARKKFKEQNKKTIVVKESESVNSYTWGLEAIDEKIKTMKKQKLTVLVSDENQGKSTFCYFLARRNYEKYKHNVYYFNLEQTEEEFIDDNAKMYAGITKIEERDNLHKTNPLYLKRLKELQENKDIHFIGRKAGGMTSIDFVIEESAKVDNMDMLIIDNLTCISVGGKSSENEQVKEIIMRLIDFAENKNVPILLVHHYRKKSRKSESSFRDVHDMKGSGSIKDLANMVIQIARTSEPNCAAEYAEFHIREGKIRGGGSREEITIYHNKGDFEPYFLTN